MGMACQADDSHEMSSLTFWKNENIYLRMSVAAVMTGSIRCNTLNMAV